jgi:hypothetical protein
LLKKQVCKKCEYVVNHNGQLYCPVDGIDEIKYFKDVASISHIMLQNELEDGNEILHGPIEEMTEVPYYCPYKLELTVC